MAYQIYKYGQITRLEAGVIYKASREGNIKVLPETIKALYDLTTEYLPYARERYNRDYLFYDRIYSATEAILEKNFSKAQEELDCWEKKRIECAGKKSSFYKYKK